MIDPFKYEVKRVGGPGSPGILFVEGEKFNVSRFYAPPAAPNITPQPGDIVSYDASGMPSHLAPGRSHRRRDESASRARRLWCKKRTA